MKKIIYMAAAFAAIIPALCACSKEAPYDMTEHIGVCKSPDKAEAAQSAGVSYIEIGISSFLLPEKSDEEFANNLAAAQNSPLPIISGNGYYPGDIQLVGPDADLERAVKYSETALARAEAIGLKFAVLGSSRARSIPDGFSREEAEQQFVTLLKKLGPIAQKHGITIVIEPLRTQETNFINSVREGTRIAKLADHPTICVLADFYHMAQIGEDAGAIVEAGDLLKHCHIAEGENRTAPGVAGDDFTPYFKALMEIGYRGNISMECRWTDFETEIGPAVAEMKRQINSLKQ